MKVTVKRRGKKVQVWHAGLSEQWNYPSQFMWTMLEQSGYQTTGQPVIEQSTLISELLL